MKKLTILTLALAAAAGIFTSCEKHNAWSVSGDIAGAGDGTLVVEAFNNGRWYVVDSVKAKDGHFNYTAAAPAEYPEVMRLGLEGRFIYFPVDSVDRVIVKADASSFDSGYTLSGTPQACSLQALDSIINASVASRGAEATVNDGELKHKLFTMAYDAPGVMPLYYLINKTVSDKALFNINNATDRRLFGAVAQRFATQRPDDPRTDYLAAIYRQARLQNGDIVATSLDASEVKLLEIERYDVKGNLRSLADIADKGNVTLLSFTAYGASGSPAYTAILNKVYDKYHDRGLEIYQLGFDADEAVWKENARNMPWITVWNSTTDGDRALRDYNVGALPVTFIIDRTATIRERITDPEELDKAVQKYL